MHLTALSVVFVLTVVQCYGSEQVQMPVASELMHHDDDLPAQIEELQKNVSAIWKYIYELRSAVSHHLTHLRQHQVELESSMHKMEHIHESDSHSSSHHHSGEQHSHSGDEHHSHSGDEHHSHSGDEHHSHSGDEHHSHNGDEHHSHSGEHSHGSDDTHGSMESHSHSGEHHSHGDDHGHHSHSYSHSHSSHDHGDSHSHGSHDDNHGHEHKDSHETEDFQQQTQKADSPVVEPIVAATNRPTSHPHHHQVSRPGSVDGFNLINEHSHHHHHHHDGHNHDSTSSSRNRTVLLPKYSEYGLYDLAMCRVLPNRDIPEDQQQNVIGTITLWQKKTGGPLNLHVRLQGFDVGDHHGHQQQQSVEEEDNETPQVRHRHGFHIHTYGVLSTGCQSTGPHYNPKGVNHGKPGPDSISRHVGDLGNIECDEHGNTNIVFSDDIVSLRGQYSVIGKSIVIHTKDDDYGLGGDAESLKTGNAGTRIACCVIQKVDKIPIRQYKSMKAATQHQNH